MSNTVGPDPTVEPSDLNNKAQVTGTGTPLPPAVSVALGQSLRKAGGEERPALSRAALHTRYPKLRCLPSCAEVKVIALPYRSLCSIALCLL
jgi:hypothetical protein